MILTFLFTFFLLFNPTTEESAARWGQIGHYVTGEIAEYHMTPAARERVNALLGTTSMALASVWMDDIRSESRFDYTNTWHWATIEDGKTYEETQQDEGGNIIHALETLIAELKQGGLPEEEEREKLKLVMHMIGDIHQPLHVGTGTDRGGNDVRVYWMGENSNLHRVWDSDIINSLQMSYSELSKELNKATPQQIIEWQSASVRDWAIESVSFRDRIYDLPENSRIGYEYRYFNKDILYKRLLQAGVRMAGVLNDIYGE